MRARGSSSPRSRAISAADITARCSRASITKRVLLVDSLDTGPRSVLHGERTVQTDNSKQRANGRRQTVRLQGGRRQLVFGFSREGQQQRHRRRRNTFDLAEIKSNVSRRARE